MRPYLHCTKKLFFLKEWLSAIYLTAKLGLCSPESQSRENCEARASVCLTMRLLLAIPEARRVGMKFFRSINMREVVTRTVDISSKGAAC